MSLAVPAPMLAFDRLTVYASGERELNESDLGPGEMPEIQPWLIEDLITRTTCPYCSEPVKAGWHVPGSDGDGNATLVKELETQSSMEFALVQCYWCAYWCFMQKSEEAWPTGLFWHCYLSKARSFATVMPEGFENELSQALRRKPDMWATLDPLRLERLVATIMKANHEECDVMHVGRTNDGGVDVVMTSPVGKQWLIQVKGRSTARGESVTTVRQLLGVMYHDRELRGIVVSTANHFTYQARTEAARVGDVIELVDRGKLSQLLSPLIPPHPWRALLDEYDCDLGDGVNGREVFGRLAGSVGLPGDRTKAP